MSGVTAARSLRYATIDDPVSDDFTELLAQDAARELDLIDTARAAAMKRPVVFVRSNTTQAIAVATPTIITYTTEDVDTHGMVNLGTSNSRATVSASSGAGLYYVSLTMSASSFSWSVGEITLRKNGGNQVRRKYWNSAGNTTLNPHISAIMWLGAVADYVDALVYHEGGGSDNISSAELKLFKLTTN